MLSVVVPATDSPPTLDLCLEAVRRALPPGGEVIAVTAPAGAGPAAARNAGAERARGDVLVFVDADVVVEPGALAALERVLAGDPGLGAVFGAYDAEPAAPGMVSRFRNLLHHHTHASSPGPAETFWAGLGAVRAADFRRVGGFDAARYEAPSVEDIELGMRLREQGVAIRLDPSIRGKHLKSWSLRSMLATDFRRRGLPWTRLMLERGSRSATLNLTPRRRAAAALALGAAGALAFRRPGLAVASAASMALSNAGFYGVLRRNGGWRLALAGVPLEALHHLAAVASAVVAVGSHAFGRGDRA